MYIEWREGAVKGTCVRDIDLWECVCMYACMYVHAYTVKVLCFEIWICGYVCIYVCMIVEAYVYKMR